MKSSLIFGATGSIGNYIYTQLLKCEHYNVVGTTRQEREDMIQVNYDDMYNLEKIR